MRISSYIFVYPKKCFKLHGTLFFEASEINSNHLEADSRIFCHIFHAVKIQTAHITIISADKDVFILEIYFWNKLICLGCLCYGLTVHIRRNLFQDVILLLNPQEKTFVIFCQHYTHYVVGIRLAGWVKKIRLKSCTVGYCAKSSTAFRKSIPQCQTVN